MAKRSPTQKLRDQPSDLGHDPPPTSGRGQEGDDTSFLASFLLGLTGDRGSLRRIAGSVGWLVAESALRLILGMVLWIWIARYLGPERFGLLSYAMALVAMTSPLVSLGFEEIAVRELVKAPTEKGEILGTILGLKSIGGLAAFLVALATVALLSPDHEAIYPLVAVLAAGSLLRAAEVFAFHFQSLVLSKYVALSRGLTSLVMAVARSLLILFGAALIAFAWAGLAEAAVTSLLLTLFFLYHADPRSRRLSFRFRRARALLHDSWPLIFSNLMILLYMRADQIMLEHMTAPEELGKYAAAVTLSEAWFFLPLAIVTSVFPKIVEAKEHSPAGFHQRLQRLFDLMSLLSYGAALAITLVAHPAVSLLYGREYEGAAGILTVLAWSGIFVSLGVARSSYLAAMNWTRFHLVSVTLGCVVNIGLNLYLIPRWQGMGAAFATLIAMGVSAYASCFFYRPTLGVGRMMTRSLLPIRRRSTTGEAA